MLPVRVAVDPTPLLRTGVMREDDCSAETLMVRPGATFELAASTAALTAPIASEATAPTVLVTSERVELAVLATFERVVLAVSAM